MKDRDAVRVARAMERPPDDLKAAVTAFSTVVSEQWGRLIMDSVSLTGYWWLPSAPRRRVAGTLTYVTGGYPELELWGTLSDRDEVIPGGLALGLANDGHPVTVEVDFETNRSHAFAQGARVLSQTLAVRRAIVGAHLSGDIDRQFTRLSIDLTDLHSWTGWPGPTWAIPQDSARRQVGIAYIQPEDVQAELPWGTLRLVGTWANQSDGPRQRSLRVGAGFLCERRTSANLETWLDEVVGPLRDFVSIATDRGNQVVNVSVEPKQGGPFAKVIYAPSDVELPTRPGNPREYPFTASSLGEGFERVLQHWFELATRSGSALDLYLSNLYRPSAHLENRFLNAAQAAEAYHRQLYPTTAETIERHRSRIDRIRVLAADNADRDLIKRLKYLYEPSLEARLLELLRRTEPVFAGLFDGRRTSKRVADVRNLLIHNDPASAVARPTGHELLVLKESVSLLFLACLCLDFGFETSTVKVMLQRTPRWRNLEVWLPQA